MVTWWKGIRSSFRFAINGILQTLRSQPNLRIHFLVGSFVLVATVFLPLSTFELLWIVFSVFIVIAFEMLNSLVEYLLDLFYPYFHEKVQKAKDISAGIVLVASIFAVVVGLIIFGKHVFQTPDAIGILAFLLFLVTLYSVSRKVMRSEKNSRSDL